MTKIIVRGVVKNDLEPIEDGGSENISTVEKVVVTKKPQDAAEDVISMF